MGGCAPNSADRRLCAPQGAPRPPRAPALCPGSGTEPARPPTMKCSLRVCFLSTAFLLIFVMSVLFTYSHHSIAYLDPGGLGGIHRVKLVPGYAGVRRLSHGVPYPRGCACRRCPEDAAATAAAWFDSRYDGGVSPVWTKENMELPPDVQRWWMVSHGGCCGISVTPWPR